jgi:ABC-type branched-subunit amino acid transport system substrate-binding protein
MLDALRLHRRRMAALLPLLFAATAATAATAAAPLTASEKAGRQIFEEGVSPSGGAITAKVGASSFDIPATAVPCGNCHGQDGLGRPEGGLVPSNIQWSELTKPYGHVHPPNRKHGPFDAKSLERAISGGVDPAGNALEAAMPRYRMPEKDMKDLIAYIKKLEHLLPPGVEATTLRIGTVLPMTGRFGEVGRAVRGVIESTLEGINRKGGIYGRKIELRVADYGEGPEQAYANAWEMVRGRQVFLLLAPFTAGWEQELARMVNDERVPVVGPITLFPEDPRASNLFVFHLLSGAAELAEVLAVHAEQSLKLKDKPAVLLYGEGKSGKALADIVEARLSERGWKSVSRQVLPADAAEAGAVVRQMKEAGAASLFVLGTGMDILRLGQQAETVGWTPTLLVPGPLAPREIVDLPAAFKDKIYLAYPTVPSDQKPGSLQQYAAMFQEKPLIRAHQTIQVPAYVAVLATVEVLKLAGRDINRNKFVTTFESLHGYDSGMLPPLSYTADRRIGALGGYVVAVDPERKDFRPIGGFVRVQ